MGGEQIDCSIQISAQISQNLQYAKQIPTVLEHQRHHSSSSSSSCVKQVG